MIWCNNVRITSNHDYSWLYYFDVSSVGCLKSSLQKCECERSVKKIIIKFYAKGILERECIGNQQTGTALWYTKEYLPCVFVKFKQLHPNSRYRSQVTAKFIFYENLPTDPNWPCDLRLFFNCENSKDKKFRDGGSMLRSSR